jgi:molybdate transport system ATP-binding protein
VLSVDVRRRLGAFELRARFESGGETIVLFGPSGSGKSLTLQAIAGLLRPESGRIVLGDHVLFDAEQGVDLPPEARGVGYLPQGYALFPHLTVRQNVAYGLSHLPKAEAHQRVEETIELLRLRGLEERLPRQTSGGQQQRTALARALVVRPRVLLLDEPFAALDAEIRRTLRAELVELQRRVGIAVVLVTHDPAEAYAVGDRVAVYDAGRVLQVGRTAEVWERPAVRAVAELTATRNVLVGRVHASTPEGTLVHLGPYEVDAPPSGLAPNTSVDVCIRPEHVLLVRPSQPPHVAPRSNLLEGEIVRELAYGTHYTLYLRLDRPIRGGDYDLEVDVPAHPYEVMEVARQRRWCVSLKRSALHLIPR